MLAPLAERSGAVEGKVSTPNSKNSMESKQEIERMVWNVNNRIVQIVSSRLPQVICTFILTKEL